METFTTNFKYFGADPGDHFNPLTKHKRLRRVISRKQQIMPPSYKDIYIYIYTFIAFPIYIIKKTSIYTSDVTLWCLG